MLLREPPVHLARCKQQKCLYKAHHRMVKLCLSQQWDGVEALEEEVNVVVTGVAVEAGAKANRVKNPERVCQKGRAHSINATEETRFTV